MLLQDISAIKLVSAALVVYLVYWALHPWVFSPLRKVPGPWYTAYTKWWIAYKTVQGVRAKTIHDLHVKYGATVKIGPNEVSTCDPEAIVPIYGTTSKFIKTEFYTYQLRGIPEIFTISSQKQHAQRRRLMAHVFSMSTIKEYEAVVSDNTRLCMDFIEKQGLKGQVSNLYDWFHYLSMDIICELCFGSTFNMLREGPSSTYIQDMYGSLEIEPVRYHFGWLNKYVAWAPLKFVRDAEACSIRSFAKGVRMVREYCESPEKKRSKDVLQKMIDAREDDGQPLSVETLNVEATGLILAGSHTTSSSLTWIIWRLLLSPTILQKLQSELDEALPHLPKTDVPPHEHLEHLPYLNAVVKEGLRIDTAVPGSTPRYVPAGGAQIGAFWAPGGTVVSAQAYSCHRDPAVFPDPETFLPERWLHDDNDDGGETPEMRRLYIPFGADGPRKCIGIHLANMELRVILAALVYRFDMRMVEMGEGDMEMHELWLAAPCRQKLMVKARQRG